MARFLKLHESSDILRQALTFTEADSGFSQRLIEKDYYCSLLLADFEPLFANGLVFKGGTSLSKVHAGFFRLSEDLDFAISIATSAGRAERSKAAGRVKAHLDGFAERTTALAIATPLKGHNGCRQYEAILAYSSAVTGERETIKVQVAVREPIIESTVSSQGRTLLRDPMLNSPEETPLLVQVLSLRETYAEKARAALTRNPPAIRDIFDIAEAVRAGRLDLSRPEFLALVRQKLAVPGNAPIDESRERRKSLEDQLETHLKPVLRSADYSAFDIETAFAHVEELAAIISNE